MYTDITNGLAPYNNPNIRLWFFEVPPLSTNGSPANSYAYSLAYETNSWTVNQLCLTNSNFYFYRVIPRWDYLTQFLLNTNNGYTVDGLHFNGANKRVNYHVVNTMFGDAWVDPSTQTIK